MEEKKIYEAHSLLHIDSSDHVRLRPKMYFEKCFQDNNLNTIILGAVCHAIDEYFDGNCNEIIINTEAMSFTVKYNAGMSLEKSHDLTKAECIMTKIGACSNEKKHLEAGDEFCRIGMAAINAASEKCELVTICNKQKGHFIFENGKTVFREIVKTEVSEEFTTISFKINKEIFRDFTFELNDLRLKINILRAQLPGMKLEFYKP